MPAPGDQYHGGNASNPFEERVVNQFTAREIATLQSRLNKQLGPEYISQRPGNGGGKVAYLEGNKAIALANDVFGFNGWSSSLQQTQIDYVDENPQNGRVSLGLSIIVRITLKDGTYHEDIGYGSIENGKGKAASFEKAKKEAATDGLKRALRTFGNVLGNCLYDKDYLKKVQAMKSSLKPIKFEESNLYRHPGYAPKIEAQVKEEIAMIKTEPHRTPVRTNQVLRTRTEHLNESFSAEFDDDYDGNLFDGVEITEHQGDEFTFETIPALDEQASKVIEAAKSANALNGLGPNRGAPGPDNGPPVRQPNPRIQSAPNLRAQTAAQQYPQNQGPGRPPIQPPISRGAQTPNPQQNTGRPEQNRQRMPQPTVDIHTVPKPANQPPQQHQQPSNQPLRPTPPETQGQAQPNQTVQPKAGPVPTTPATNPPATHRPPVGFVTSRAAELMQNSESTTSLNHLPAFNPHAESPLPQDKRTPGIDHTRSMAIKRQEVNAPIPPPLQSQPQPPGLQRASGGPGPRSNGNYVNPHLDGSRRIGAPMVAMSPSANRGAYKPPSMVGGIKRERQALQDVSNQSGNQGQAEGPEAKKQKVDVAGTENAALAVGSS